MSRDRAWYRRNDNYLAAALALLRHRLNSAAPDTPPAMVAEAIPDEPRRPPRRGWFGGLREARSEEEEQPILLPEAPPAPVGAEEKRLADAVSEAGQGDPPPAVPELARIFELSAFERDLLLFAIAVELDPGISARMPAAGHPTFGLAMSVLPEPLWDALAPDAPLRHWSLIRVDRSGGRPLTASPLSVDERILNHAKGLDHLDERLAPLLRPVGIPKEEGPTSRAGTVAAVAAALDPAEPAVAVLRGADRSSNEDVAARAASAHGLGLWRLAADALPSDLAGIDELARLWHREALLTPSALLVDALDGNGSAGSESLASRVSRFVGRSGGPIVVGTRDGAELPLTPLVDRYVERPSTAEQLTCWFDALAEEPESAAVARRMAARFDLDRPAIAAAVRTARAEGAGRPLAERLQQAALTRTRSDLARLAERVEGKAAFEDIVLPPTQEAQLRQIVDHLEHRITVIDEWGFGDRMNRGIGISALFAGDSGTGKTMAAEVVAEALGLDLFRIDLSAVVSKYIGETEKNLSRLFDAADRGGSVLLFDEADALFGKRSEVKEAHDRFANIEIDYLLQRMESYRGIAILTTNMKSALDPAFKRRLRFIVDFPYPGPADRRRIWERAIPRAAPKGAIDLDRLARLDLTGAGIQSVALNGAFLAAARKVPLTTAILLEAGRSEFQKLNRPVSEADFRLDEPQRSAA
jgi:hypothetical protein